MVKGLGSRFWVLIGSILELYRDNGKDIGNYYRGSGFAAQGFNLGLGVGVLRVSG